MKKVILTLALITLVLTSKAQMWCAPGAEWHYGYVAGAPFYYGYLKSNYINDTVINTITYKKIQTTRYGYFPFGSSNLGLTLLNENSKLVTLWTGNVDTLFNFNAAIGNKWLRVRIGDVNNDVTRRYVTVLDTGHVVINSVNLKKLVLSYQSGGYLTAPITNYIDTVYEKIGSIKYFLNPAAIETSSAVLDVSGNKIEGTFRCYYDNNFALYQKTNAYNCTAIVGINELQNQNNSFTIFPNPAYNFITIQSDAINENTVIEITNALGQVVFTQNNITQNQQINIGTLPNGIYYINVFNSTKQLFTSKLSVVK